MKKIHFIFLLAVASVFALPACKNNKTSGLIVPKNAGVVVHFNAASILSKVSWEDIKQTSLFKTAYDSTKDDYKKKLLQNPENSGVDLKGDFIVFTQKHGSHSYVTFQGKLKDAAAFETLNKQVSEAAAIQTRGDLSYIRHDSTSVLTWNKSAFFLVTEENNMSGMNEMQDFSDSAFSDTTYMNNFQDDTSSKFDFDFTQKSVSADTLLQYLEQVLALKGDDLLEDDNRFADLIKEKGDIHLWMNSEQSFASLPANPMSMMKIGNLLKGNISASTINFDNGQVLMSSKQYLNKELTDLYEANKPEHVTVDLINRIPSQNVTAVFAMNLPSEGLRAFLKVSGMDGFANMMLTNFNLSVDEITNAYKGETVLSLSDLSLNEENITIEDSNFSYKSKSPEMKFFMAMAVKNRASFEKIWNLAKENLFKDTSKNKMVHNLSNEWFAISNSQESVTQFMNGTKNTFDFASKISGHPFGSYIDLKKIVPFISSMSRGNPDSAAIASTWDNVVMTGGEMVNGAIVSNMEVNLLNKNANSLKQIFTFFTTMFNANNEQGDRNRQVITTPRSDTTTTSTVAPF